MNPGNLIQLIVVAGTFIVIGVITLIAGFAVRKCGGDGKLWRKRTGITLLLLAVAAFGWIYFVNPLPSDEAMIKHLNAHRAEYEELAIGLRQAIDQGDDSVKAWLASSRTVALKRSIGARDERNSDEKTQWLAGVQVNGDTVKGPIQFSIDGGFKFSWREMNSIWKIYVYFPIAPPITERNLIECPIGSGRKCVGDFGVEVLPSLNGYPQFYQGGWRKCGVFARQIDEHWFIKYYKAC